MIDHATIASSVRISEDSTTAGKSEDTSMEKLFATMVLKEVRKSMPKDGLMGGAAGMDAFYDLFDEHIAQQIADSGALNLQTDGIPRSHAVVRYQAAAGGSADLNGSWPVEGRISSSFGMRVDPLSGEHRQHAGMDIAAPIGSAVTAASSGRVTFAGKRGGYGNLVIVQSNDGTETRYAHLSRIDVDQGDHVSATSRLGAVGDTGRATGPHLHLEVRKDGHAVDPINHFGWGNQ